MTDKQKYWIRDVEGVHALVASAAERDWWVKVHGWSDADEPGATDQVRVVNENPEIGPGQLPYGAVEDWGGLGWKPRPPPGGESAPAAEPAKPTKAPAAAGGEQKEK